MRRIPSKSPAPNVRAASQQFLRLLFCSFFSRWHFVSSHRDRATSTSCALCILRLALFQPSKATGLPAGLLVYERCRPPTPPAAACFTPPPPLGPPRHLIETTEGLVPVEVKSGACPRSGPHAAHVAQLMTYCVLVEDTLGNAGFRRPLSPGFTPWCTSAFNPSNSRDSSLRMSRAV